MSHFDFIYHPAIQLAGVAMARPQNTIENNLRKWDEKYGWPQDGDEWAGQAKLCNVDYEQWKRSLIDTFIRPNMTPTSTVLEIAPGHGRWSREMVDHCDKLILVDLGPKCIEFCRQLFADRTNVIFIVNDGKSLPGVDDESVDFVWSYDSFVHMDADTISAYLSEIRRVLRPNGQAILHHAGRRHAFLFLRFLRGWGKAGANLYRTLTMGADQDNDGWRSDVSPQIVKRSAERHGLHVDAQVSRWGPESKFGVPRFHDAITIVHR